VNNHFPPSTESAFQPAPLSKRLMALLYDSFILMALSMVYSATVTAAMAAGGNSDLSTDYFPMQDGPWFSLGWLAMLITFYWFFWMHGGQTVGMRAWQLKIISSRKHALSHKQCLIRICAGPVSLGLAGMGYFWCLFNQNKAAWHDLVSDTHVILTSDVKKKAASL